MQLEGWKRKKTSTYSLIERYNTVQKKWESLCVVTERADLRPWPPHPDFHPHPSQGSKEFLLVVNVEGRDHHLFSPDSFVPQEVLESLT